MNKTNEGQGCQLCENTEANVAVAEMSPRLPISGFFLRDSFYGKKINAINLEPEIANI